MATANTPAAPKKASASTKAPVRTIDAQAKKLAKDASISGTQANQAQTNGKVKVTQMVGSIGRRHDQEATLKGLGLNKRHRSRVLEDTPSVRGMIYKVRHLVKVEQA